jgi:hypothetical protein
MLRGVGETLEGAVVLDEFRGDAGVELWQAARDVRLWAEVDHESRPGLFRGATRALTAPLEASCDAELLAPLTLLRLELAEPSRADGEIIAAECLRVARWAARQARLGTAALFAMAASLAAPQRPGPAYEAGRLALLWRDEVRAETWLRRSVGLARRANERRTYSLALLALGDLFAARGESARARGFYIPAMRAARRCGMRAVRTAAVFGLLRLAIEAGNHAEVHRLQSIAQRILDRDRGRTPDLVVVLVRLWVDAGDRQAASETLRHLLSELTDPDQRIAALALLARADADRRMPWSIAEVWHEARALVEAHPGSPARARAMVDLALAAMELGSLDRVRAVFEPVSELPQDADRSLRSDHAEVARWLHLLNRRHGRG